MLQNCSRYLSINPITFQNAAPSIILQPRSFMQSTTTISLLLLLVVTIRHADWVNGREILTTTCSGHCDRFTPCTIEADSRYGSKYSCLSESTSMRPTSFLFSFEKNASTIGEMELSPSITRVTFRGGSNSNDTERGEVVNVDFDSSFVINSTEVTDIELTHLNLSAVVGHLQSILPETTMQLRLRNVLLKEFPTIPLLHLRLLSDLNLDSNFIEVVDTSVYSSTLQSLSMQNNMMNDFRGFFPELHTLVLNNNFFTEIPNGIYHLNQLKTLNMSCNLPLSRNFTAAQAAFLRRVTWDLKEEDFVALSHCGSSLDRIHGISFCISDYDIGSNLSGKIRGVSRSRAAVERQLYDYESYACPGRYSGGVLAGSIVGTIVFMLAIGVFVWRWQKQQQIQRKSASSLDKPMKETDNSYVSVWEDPQLIALRLNANEIEDVRKIGGGAFADVWLVKYRGTQLFASKRLRKMQETQQNTHRFVEEIKMASKFDHPNIVMLVGAAWTIESELQALSEYMVGGDLREFLIYPHTPRTWTDRKLQIATDVIEALVYLHSFNPSVVHRDLKSRNILLSKEMQAKMTDFGVSRIMSEENTMTQGVGTSRWEAPEVLAGKEDYNQAADIFSFGVVLSELDTHAIPYDDARGPNDNPLANVAILQMITVGVIHPSFSPHCPPGIRSLAHRCLAHNPSDRPSAPEVAYALRTVSIC